MKKYVYRFACLMAAPAAFSAAPAYAGNGNGQANTKIQEATDIVKRSDLEFGTIISGSTDSIVIVNPNTGGRSTFGSAVEAGGNVSPSRFELTRRPLILYTITVPSAVTISSGSDTMVIDNFTLDVPPFRLAPPVLPVDEFNVGGSLNVGANQPAGDYSGTFTVTIDIL